MLPGSVRPDNCCPQIQFLRSWLPIPRAPASSEKSFLWACVMPHTGIGRNHLYHGSQSLGRCRGFSLMAQHHTEQNRIREVILLHQPGHGPGVAYFKRLHLRSLFLFQYFPDTVLHVVYGIQYTAFPRLVDPTFREQASTSSEYRGAQRSRMFRS